MLSTAVVKFTSLPYQIAGAYCNRAHQDANQKAREQIEKATESEPVNGDDLLESEELKAQASRS
jgi:hypothetical protein